MLFPTPIFSQGSIMKIHIETHNKQQSIIASLADNPTARDFYKLLPLKLKLSNYAGVEKIGNLDSRLSTKDAPRSYAGRKGDLTYYAPWGNIAIFTDNSNVGEARGLIYFGRFEQGLEHLHQLPDDTEIIIRPVQ
ncbi:hypothetical protein HKX40_00770 [Pelistega europaea]|uniref:Cyclophilin-like domain-containing protein n=2 Tax=Pelistega europaea TaxID=106147 RepID=A0A7Y4P4G0_9BURK|nr:hypothetical protein [Pelistega europaea]